MFNHYALVGYCIFAEATDNLLLFFPDLLHSITNM